MKKILMAALLTAAPLYAHDMPKGHAHQGEPADAPRSFDQQPALGTWAKCAVSGDIFRVDADTEFATYRGRVYAFCCPDCKPDFVKQPEKYAESK